MLTLNQFIETATRVTDSELSATMGFDYESLGNPESVILYDDSLYITQDGGSFWTTCNGYEKQGVQNDVAAFLYFEWYVSECVENPDLGDLTFLWGEWCKWSDVEYTDAQEILLTLCTDSPEQRDANTRRKIEWVEWFIRAWEDAESRDIESFKRKGV